MVAIIDAAVDATADPQPHVRLFYAWVPAESVRARFAALAREVARRCRGRAISGDHVHLTLAFLGDVAAGSLPALRSVGDRLAHAGGILEFDTLGGWRASGVSWVAPSQVPPGLLAMHAALRTALVEAGFDVDTRAFRPHVTLARRCMQPQTRARCASIQWPIERLCLIASELKPEGPRYMELAAWPLAVTAD
ncbi:MAG: RNA 2',3'-cyclic phosphodiesterase [Burkholderiales bacterium]|nr:RNA 2',3'-cyclic phosphodiesterase [Burkholderiales bacterium]